MSAQYTLTKCFVRVIYRHNRAICVNLHDLHRLQVWASRSLKWAGQATRQLRIHKLEKPPSLASTANTYVFSASALTERDGLDLRVRVLVQTG